MVFLRAMTVLLALVSIGIALAVVWVWGKDNKTVLGMWYMLQGVLGRRLREPLPVGAGELVMEQSFGHVHPIHIGLSLGQGVAVLLGRGVLRGLGRRLGSGLGRGRGLLGGGGLRHLRLGRPFRDRDGRPMGCLGRSGRGLAAPGPIVEGEGQDDKAGQHDLPGRL